jgi:predicted nuclease of restriction endonuclease-like (RecB) superfamily
MKVTTYTSLFSEIKDRIRQAQVKATLAVNAQMIALYWDIGKMISERQNAEGWGTNVIRRLSIDLKNELPELKGFSTRNLEYMLRFANEYSILQQPVAEFKYTENQNDIISQQAVAELENLQLLLSIPWGHNLLLMEKIKNVETRFWYLKQVVEHGWSRDVLRAMIKSNAFDRRGSVVNNFDNRLTDLQSELVKQTLKDPYVFDFLTLAEPFAERELETELIKHIEFFLLELGTGFAFVGRQYHIAVGGKDFNIDF